MHNLTAGNFRIVLPSMALLARSLAKQHLNHDRRRSRMETLHRIIEVQMKMNDISNPDYANWLNVLHLVLFATIYEDLTHTEVKGVLYHFADLCDTAYQELAALKET